MYWHDFTFNQAELRALPAGALLWRAKSLLCVSDLHLGKSERLARRAGQLTPPYDSLETLTRLKDLIDQHNPQTVICLGDSFDDTIAGQDLAPDLLQLLSTLTAGRKWIWITGNHDPGLLDLQGSWLHEVKEDYLTFRHIAEKTCQAGEVSGHFHPKASLKGRSRPCFCYDERRLILPAFGTYTGGLKVSDPNIASLFGKEARAVMTGARTITLPLKSA